VGGRLGSIPSAWKSMWGRRFLRSDQSLRDDVDLYIDTIGMVWINI